MTGMEHAIEKAARIIHGCTGDEDGAPVAARALAEAGLLAPAPLTEEWGKRSLGWRRRTYTSPSFNEHDARNVDWDETTVRRYATDWLPVDCAEGESWYDAEPDAMPDAGWEPIEPVDRTKGDGRAEP